MAEQVGVIESDGAIHIPLALWRQVGLGPGAQVRIEPAPDRLVISSRQSVVDRLMGKIHVAPQLAAEIIAVPELNVEAG
jgi:antitoxin component of MazEF toxin-antitoxin module